MTGSGQPGRTGEVGDREKELGRGSERYVDAECLQTRRTIAWNYI